MNQLLTRLTTNPSTEIHHTSFTETATDILDWLENFDRIAAHNFGMIKSSCKLSLST